MKNGVSNFSLCPILTFLLIKYLQNLCKNPNRGLPIVELGIPVPNLNQRYLEIDSMLQIENKLYDDAIISLVQGEEC
jgi:hypothetical protein